VEAESNHMQLLSKCLPLEHNKLNEIIAFENVYELILYAQINEGHILVDEVNWAVFVFNVLTQESQHIDLIFHLVNLTAVDNWCILIVWHQEVLFMEHLGVIVAQIKNCVIIWSHVIVFVSMCGWPLIKIKCVTEYLAVEQFRDVYTLINELFHVFVKEER